MLLDDTKRLDKSSKWRVIAKTKCFYSFTNNSKSKAKLKQFRTLFLRHSLRTVLDTKLKRFHGFFELEILQIFT